MNSAPKSIEKEENMSDLEIDNKFNQILSTFPTKKDAWSMDYYQYERFLVPFLPYTRNIVGSRTFQASTQQSDFEQFSKMWHNLA